MNNKPAKTELPKTYVVQIEYVLEHVVKANSEAEAKEKAELRCVTDGDFVSADEPRIVDSYYE